MADNKKPISSDERRSGTLNAYRRLAGHLLFDWCRDEYYLIRDIAVLQAKIDLSPSPALKNKIGWKRRELERMQYFVGSEICGMYEILSGHTLEEWRKVALKLIEEHNNGKK